MQRLKAYLFKCQALKCAINTLNKEMVTGQTTGESLTKIQLIDNELNEIRDFLNIKPPKS